MPVTNRVFKPVLNAGQVYLRQAGDQSAVRYPIGNVSVLNLAIDEEVIEQKDYTSPGGGTHAEVRRINSVTTSMTLHDLNADNIALATRGTAAEVAQGTITDEQHTAAPGGFVRLNHPGPSSVVVTNDAGTTTYDAGDDYEVTGGGLKIVNGGAINTATVIKVDYSHKAYIKVEALTTTGKPWEIFFDGLNEADDGNEMLIDLWKVNLGAASELGIITDDLGNVTLEGKLLSDNSKGANESKFFRTQQV